MSAPDDTARVRDSSQGKQLGPYRIVRELGRGGMGAVYEAVHETSGATYAVKTLRFDGHGLSDPQDLARFKREAELGARLDHPHVARVHSADFEGRLWYLVQDVLPGGSLHERLRAGPLPLDDARRIAIQLGQALAHAHERGVLHRDVTPKNVMFDDQGQPRLVDFGLSRDLLTRQRLTLTGDILGTPIYMAPEQTRDTKTADARTDVYGLGGLLYAMLTGQPPLARPVQTLQEAFAVVRNEEPAPPSKHRPDVPAGLEAVCLKALSRDAADRYGSVAEMVAALEAQGEQPDDEFSTKTLVIAGVFVMGLPIVVALVLGIAAPHIKPPGRFSAVPAPTSDAQGVVPTPTNAPARKSTAPASWATWRPKAGTRLAYRYTRWQRRSEHQRRSFSLLLHLKVDEQERRRIPIRCTLARVRFRFVGPFYQCDFDSSRPRQQPGTQGEVEKAFLQARGKEFSLLVDARDGRARPRGIDRIQGAVQKRLIDERLLDPNPASRQLQDLTLAGRFFVEAFSRKGLAGVVRDLPSLERGDPRGRPTLGRAAYAADGTLVWAAIERGKRAAREVHILQRVETHTIRSGENLLRIARRRGAFVGALATHNRIDAPSLIRSGDVLELPPPLAPPVTGTPSLVRLTADRAWFLAQRWGTFLHAPSDGLVHVLLEKVGNWSRIQWGGSSAWVQSVDLQPIPIAKAVVVTQQAAVSSKPRAQGRGLKGYARPGQAFPLIQRQGAWVQIQFDERRLWVPVASVRLPR